MTRWLDREGYLETGLLVLGGLIVGCLALFAVSRVVGAAQRRARHHAGPPAPGSVPPQRHQNIAADYVQ